MKKIIIIALGVISLGSCKKSFEKININPNEPSSATPELLFSGAAVNLANTRVGGDQYVSLVLAVQTLASGGNSGWGAGDVYDVSPYSTGNIWRTNYVSSGANLKQAIKFAEESSPVKYGTIGQCQVLLAETMYETTMMFGDIPYSEAWRKDITYPHFDGQEAVMNGLLTLLDEAIGNLKNTNASQTTIKYEDFFYAGDAAKWLALANSLKFKILMTMVDKDPSKATALATLMTEDAMMKSATGNMTFKFGTATGNQNLKFAILNKYAGGTNAFFFANKTVIDPMLAQNDPRIPKYFEKGTAATNFVGVATEATGDFEQDAIVSMQLFAADAPEYLMTYQELLFLQAEAAARNLIPGGLATAEAKYQEALKEACLLYKVSATDAATFASSKTLSAATAVKEIHLQQWIDLMDRPLEAFNNWRRSGTKGNETPTLTIPPGAPAGNLIYRLLWPTDNEILPNVNAPKGVFHYYDQLWFDL
ncbi:SusD/RagB family nutrient-binding outer membrane lipoprotein [Taibaiella sp. KBW10]|uniref:SusD/RagB family nutrient-binding outer membrane lipoprotein n=1 Tax=Taibaiella sp. KBW10 TaxID=2153357 RepID=UPI000F5902A6|nr:SusD/RagB family nutrient-binding outer membrane lipoprotein [Taibaiella sp. KBW10]RQO32009.1 SusD/RagB family nutrient-binding outer membrane lipoprotein [Taibaiella sp. KBW10]